MTFNEWWEKHDQVSDPFSNFTYGEQVWQAAQSDTWGAVFQIVSDNADLATREFIRLLEAAREEDGYGPLSAR